MSFLKTVQKNRGMTYVELIVVISIVALLSTVSLFNYGEFQDRVDIKNLANDVALKVTEAQKNSIAGRVPATGAPLNWRPSYGVYFDINTDKTFNIFTDINGDKKYTCPGAECTSGINITKGNYISHVEYFLNDNPNPINNPLHITFTRPNSGAVFYVGSSLTPLVNLQFVQITLSSPNVGIYSVIKIYPSGRVQIK
ncbi:MAG: type II secretion system protein [Candidatus Paceibacterota bacterium]